MFVPTQFQRLDNSVLDTKQWANVQEHSNKKGLRLWPTYNIYSLCAWIDNVMMYSYIQQCRFLELDDEWGLGLQFKSQIYCEIGKRNSSKWSHKSNVYVNKRTIIHPYCLPPKGCCPISVPSWIQLCLPVSSPPCGPVEGTPHGSGPGQRREACRELVCTLEGREPRWASGQVEGEQTCLVFQLGAMCVWVCTCSGGKVGGRG